MDTASYSPEGRQTNWTDSLANVVGAAGGIFNAFKGTDTESRIIAAPSANPPPPNNNLVLWIALGLVAVLTLGLILKR